MLRQSHIADVIDPSMYRKGVDRKGKPTPQVWPRHYSQWAAAFDGETWLLVPLETDEQIALTMANGTNLEHSLRSFRRYANNPTVENEFPKHVLHLVLLYLMHVVDAPLFAEEWDHWLVQNGEPPWEVSKTMDEYSADIGAIGTPAELVQFAVSLQNRGFGFLAATTREDVQWLWDQRAAATAKALADGAGAVSQS